MGGGGEVGGTLQKRAYAHKLAKLASVGRPLDRPTPWTASWRARTAASRIRSSRRCGRSLRWPHNVPNLVLLEQPPMFFLESCGSKSPEFQNGLPWQVETWTKTCGLPLLFHFEPHPNDPTMSPMNWSLWEKKQGSLWRKFCQGDRYGTGLWDRSGCVQPLL